MQVKKILNLTVIFAVTLVACGDDSGKKTNGDAGGDASTCTPATEVLDGKDNNCDQSIDEGFWVKYVANAAKGDLEAKVAACPATSNADNLASFDCARATNLYCQAQGYALGLRIAEVGSLEYGLACVSDVATESNVAFATLQTMQALCTKQAGYSVYCNSAVNRYCKDKGFVSGVGPTSVVNDQSTGFDLACIKHGTIMQAPFAELTAKHDMCEPGAGNMSVFCMNAYQKWCVDKGYQAGYGPLEIGADTIEVVCLNPS